MYNKIILMLKGVIIGVANIIPGVSGGTLAITLGLYERLISAITTFFKDFKNNIKFLFPIGIGAIIGLVLISKLIVGALDLYPVQTNIFFTGLILGGLPMLLKKTQRNEKNILNIFILIVVLFSLVGLTFIKSGDNVISFINMNLIDYVKLFGVGIIGAATMVIPGVSGSFVLMIIGYYRPILDTINKLTEFHKLGLAEIFNNVLILAAFGIGILVGILLIAKIIEYFLNNYETPTYYAIIGFVLGSIFIILKPLLTYNLTAMTIIISVALGVIGFTIAYFLGER